MEHIREEELNALVDGRLDKDTAQRVQDHLAHCRRCREAHGALVLLASGMDRLVAPSTSRWANIQRRHRIKEAIHELYPEKAFQGLGLSVAYGAVALGLFMGILMANISSPIFKAAPVQEMVMLDLGGDDMGFIDSITGGQ